jgi:hypothetical protein
MPDKEGQDRTKDLLQEAQRNAALPPASKPDDVALTVFALYEHAIEAYKPWYAVNDEDREFYKGNQAPKKPKLKSNIVDNEIRSAIDTMQPKILDSIGEADLSPITEDDVEPVKALNERIKYAMRECKLVAGRKKVVKDVLRDGGAIIKADSSVSARQIDWRRIVREPEASSFNDAFYIIDQVLETYADTVEQFGRRAKGVATQTEPIEGNKDITVGPPKDSGTALTLTSAPVNATTPATRYIYNMTGNEFTKAERVLRLECWIRDKSKHKVTDENGEEIEKLVYPHGRVVNVAVSANKEGIPERGTSHTPEVITLRDRPNPFETLYKMTAKYDENGKEIQPGRFPITLILCYDAEEENVWGLSAIRPVIPLQKKLNFVWNQLFDNTDVVVNPPKIVSGMAGVKKGDIKGVPNEVIILNPGNELDVNKAMQFVSIPSVVQHLVPVIHELKDAIRSVLGVMDVTRGETPGAVTAASAIHLLQVKADNRLLLGGARISDGYKEVAENLAYIAQDFDAEPMEIPDESYDEDKKFTQYDPETVRGKKLRVTGERRMTIGEIIEILTAGVQMEVNFPGAMKLILMHADDPRLHSLYLQISKQNTQDAAAADTREKQHEVALEAMKQIGGQQTQLQPSQ